MFSDHDKSSQAIKNAIIDDNFDFYTIIITRQLENRGELLNSAKFLV